MSKNTYEYRNLACNFEGAEDDNLWCVVGYDTYNDIGGVLEWCTSKEDAEEVLKNMSNFKHFNRLRIMQWEPRSSDDCD